MEKKKGHILLKWGTLKGWDFKNSPEAYDAFQEYNKLGMSFSCMAQKDTKRQKELICIMIDKINGEVQNDWSGETYKDLGEAKKYVMQYNR